MGKDRDQRNALQLSQTLLAGQIMPIVQIVRDAPGPGPLSATELDEVEQLVHAGVRYFEFDSEPDRAAFWGRERLPADALAVTARRQRRIWRQFWSGAACLPSPP